MIKVVIPGSLEFEKYKDECRKLYEQNQDKISDPSSFEFIINNTFFYMFLKEDFLIGALYYFLDEQRKLFVNGFSKRKTHLLNIKCLKMSFDWFNDDIYAQAQNRMSAICLLRCGFKRIDSNTFMKKNTNKEHSSGKDFYVF